MSNYKFQNARDYLSDNIQNANYAREKKEYMRKQELESDKRAMASLAQQLEEEKQMEKNRKRQIQNAQFQEYSNYMKNKYQNHNPNLNNRDNNLQIKIGGENRYLTRKNYNQENENLCINPTTIQLKQNNQTINYSEQGRINQRGQSHGYNIISNEPFQNISNEKKNINQPLINQKEEINNNNINYQQMQNLNQNIPQQYNNPNQMELNNNINKGYEQNIQQDINQNYTNQMYQNPNLDMYSNNNNYNIPSSQYQKIEGLNDNLMPSQQNIQQNNNLPKDDDRPSEEDYRRYNEYLEMLKKQEEEQMNAYYKAQGISIDKNYLQNPNIDIPQNNNINDMNKPLDLYEEYLRKGNPNLNNNIPQMQNNIPQIENNLPQMQNNIPQMQNNIPQMQNNIPQMNPNDNQYLDQNYNNYMQQNPNQNYLLQQNEILSQRKQPQMEDPNIALSRQMNNMSLDARNEYLANKKKNNSSFNNLLSDEPIIPPQDKYNSYSPFTISNYDKAQKQKQYKEYLDSQMNAKKLYKDTYYNLEKGQPTIQQRLNNESNPYLEMREKNNKLSEIPQNPYSSKNYNFGKNSSLSNNPITNTSYNENRRVSSGRLQSLGNNIVNQ